MKEFKVLVIILTVFFIGFISCNQADEADDFKVINDGTSSEINKPSDDATSSDTILDSESLIQDLVKNPVKAEATAYICPFNCESGKTDHAGECSDCGMDLIENPDYTGN